jgi:hypothetical protein
MKKTLLVSTLLFAFLIDDLNVSRSAELRITGRIMPPVCTSAFFSSDSNNLPSESPYIQRMEVAELTRRFDKQIIIVCEEPTQFVVRAIDNRMDSRHLSQEDKGEHELGLGRDVAGNKIGRISFTALSGDVEINGGKGGFLLSDDRGKTWRVQDRVFLYTRPTYSISWHSANQSTLAPIKSLSMRLDANIYLAPVQHGTQDVNLDGAVTLELIYL